MPKGNEGESRGFGSRDSKDWLCEFERREDDESRCTLLTTELRVQRNLKKQER